VAHRIGEPALGALGSLRDVVTEARFVALTYDDGPDPNGTPAVLDALAAAGMTASFFVLADRAEAHPELVRRTVAEGHEVGLHGCDHTRLTTLDDRDARRSIEDGRRRVEAVAGRPVRFFRPPFGAQRPSTLRAARRAGLEVVVWSVDARDWEPDPPAEVAARALTASRPGAVILLHDGRADDDGPDRPGFERGAIATRLLAGLAERDLASASLTRALAGGRPGRALWFRP
jgi:peptidoglycan/xylan/chitin deacetylase (PgdA/CDA1 family)